MSLLDTLMGTNSDLSDMDIASDMLKDSKFSVMSLSMAVTETANPEIRNFLSQQLTTAIDSHYRLSDLASNKKWYQPYLTPQQQLSNDLRMSQKAT